MAHPDDTRAGGGSGGTRHFLGIDSAVPQADSLRGGFAMTRTFLRRGGLWLAAFFLMAAPASAQVVHSVHFGLGGFFPRGLDSRIDEDVLVRDFVGAPFPFDPSLNDALDFDMDEFRSASLFGEWNVAFGDHLEAGASLAFSSGSAPSRYLDVVDRDTGADLRQELSLRIVPITGLVRFLPFGTPATVQPYVGAGLSALLYRYSEEGEFVDPITSEIFTDRFSASGAAPGGVVLVGVRVPIRGDIFAVTVEFRQQFGSGDTGGDEEGFLADKIDLGGRHLAGGLLIRF
jgi:hypothetical protein